MLGIRLNSEVIDRCLRLVQALVGVQADTRRRLLEEIQKVCSNCDDAYSAVLARLVPVKRVYADPMKLAAELHALAGDLQTRARFKPEGLCSEIDQLLADFTSNLSGLKYSVQFFSLDEIKGTLESMGNYDKALYNQYDGFMSQLDSIASAIELESEDRSALAGYARSEIAALERDLKGSVKAMREAKDRVVELM